MPITSNLRNPTSETPAYVREARNMVVDKNDRTKNHPVEDSTAMNREQSNLTNHKQALEDIHSPATTICWASDKCTKKRASSESDILSRRARRKARKSAPSNKDIKPTQEGFFEPPASIDDPNEPYDKKRPDCPPITNKSTNEHFPVSHFFCQSSSSLTKDLETIYDSPPNVAFEAIDRNSSIGAHENVFFDAKESLGKSDVVVKQDCVVFLGKIGHGKTCLVNKLCGTAYKSLMSANSCTNRWQLGITKQYGIKIVDTPGFYSSIDVLSHVSEQKHGLEAEQHSGIYMIVKIGRVDEMAELLNKIMDFVGDDDVRIIVTHADTVVEEGAFDEEPTKQFLSEQLSIDSRNILIVGKHSSGDLIEGFIKSTLHEPKSFRVSKEQQTYVATFNVGARMFYQEITKITELIDLAGETFQRIASDAGNRRHFLELAMSEMYSATKTATNASVKKILHMARKEVSPEEMLQLKRKIHISVHDRMQSFRENADRHIGQAKGDGKYRMKRRQCLLVEVQFDKLHDGTEVANRNSVFQFKVNGKIVPLEQLVQELERSASSEQQNGLQRQNPVSKKKPCRVNAAFGSKPKSASGRVNVPTVAQPLYSIELTDLSKQELRYRGGEVAPCKKNDAKPTAMADEDNAKGCTDGDGCEKFCFRPLGNLCVIL